MKDPFRTELRAVRDRRFVAVARRSSASVLARAVIAASLSAGMLAAAVAPGWLGADDATSSVASREAPSPTRSTAAMKVYELPALSVVADRKSALATMEREDKADAFQQAARANRSAKPRA